MPDQKRLFLLDAYALIFRGYYALIKNPRINSKGMDTSAILGFTNSLLDVIKREKPDHLAVAFDKGGSVARSEAFPAYKANRQETPEAIKIAVPYIHKILEAMHIPIIEEAGFEADDLIGTLSKKAEQEGFQTFMVTPDKDFAQLVSENIFMYRPARMGNGIEVWGIDEVKEKFEVDDPIQVIDYLGMMGDAVDNIPGLPGVGDKTAKKFINQYGSMEGLLDNTHELKGKMKEKVEANKELGILSKQLATIMLDCPVEFDAENFKLSTPDFNAVNEVFRELEFRRTAENFNGIFKKPQEESETNDAPVVQDSGQAEAGQQFDLFASDQGELSNSGYKDAESQNHFYQVVQTPFSRSLLLKKIDTQQAVAFKFITKGEDPLNSEIIGLAFSYAKGKGYYVPIPANNIERSEILESFKPFFGNPSIVKISQRVKHQMKLLYTQQIEIRGQVFDTMLAHYLLQPDMRHDLNVLSESYLNYQPKTLESYIGKKGRNQLELRSISVDLQTEFGAEQVDVIFQLWQHFTKELNSFDLESLYYDVEIPVLSVLAAMEIEGIRTDSEFLSALSDELRIDISSLESAIYKSAGQEFNLASPRQLGDILFEQMKLVDKPKKTKTGQFATGEEILSKLAPKHPIVQDILNWRGLVKLQNTYVEALPEEINESTGRIHTTFSQAVAATGRLSSNNPNLQNIPIRTKRGREVRKAFIPRNEEFVIAAADYSQIELRIIASLSGDQSMIESFNRGEDIHASTAAKVFDVPLESVTREQRSDAKAVNFGIIYGQGAFTLAQQLNKSRSEAKQLIDNYYATFPRLKQFIADQVAFAREKGYVETILGRRRYLKNINSQNAIVRSADERNAVNAPIQGSAADIIKLAMIRIHKKLHEGSYRTKMLLQVHDELVFDMHREELEILKPLIIGEMESAFEMNVRLKVDMGIGSNWLEAH